MKNTFEIPWKEFLKKCDLIKKGKIIAWYSNANCHYFVNNETKEISVYYGFHGKNHFEEIEGK